MSNNHPVVNSIPISYMRASSVREECEHYISTYTHKCMCVHKHPTCICTHTHTHIHTHKHTNTHTYTRPWWMVISVNILSTIILIILYIRTYRNGHLPPIHHPLLTTLAQLTNTVHSSILTVMSRRPLE